MSDSDMNKDTEEARRRQWIEKLSSASSLSRSYPSKVMKTEQDKALIQLALHRSPFFTCLDEEQIERFIEVADLRVYAPGEMVILEGKVDVDEGDLKVLQGDTLSSKTNEPVDLDEHNPLEEAVATLKENSSGDVVGPADVEEEEDEFEQVEKEPRQTEAMNFVKAVVDAEEAVLGLDELAQSVKENRENMSGTPSYVYVVQNGHADVWHENFHTSSLGPGNVFGEGGFLFHRRHSASVVASPNSDLTCWVVPIHLFMSYVLPSMPMMQLFVKYASSETETGEPCMTMDDFVRCVTEKEGIRADDSTAGHRLANTYSILRKTEGVQKINLADFCIFHLLMARPDPEVDIAFLLMDRSRSGTISLDDLKSFLDEHEGYFDTNSEFVQRHFGKDGNRSIRPSVFSQFLADFQREIGKQAFLYDVEMNGTPEGYLPPDDFVRVLKTSCGWRLPAGVVERLESIYCRGPFEAAEAAALVSVAAEKLKGSSAKEAASRTSASILAHMEQRTKNLGDLYFTYADFLAFQDVFVQLPGICNLIRNACDIKKGPVSPDDFKVANRVIGLGGKLSRRQVDIIFQLFDLDRDGFVAPEDVASVVGFDFVRRLEAVKGREGKLTFAPPPDFRDTPGLSEAIELLETKTLAARLLNFLQSFGLAAIAGGIGATAVYPIDLGTTRSMPCMRMHHC